MWHFTAIVRMYAFTMEYEANGIDSLIENTKCSKIKIVPEFGLSVDDKDLLDVW